MTKLVQASILVVRRPPCWNSTAQHARLDTSNVSRRDVTSQMVFGPIRAFHIVLTTN